MTTITVKSFYVTPDELCMERDPDFDRTFEDPAEAIAYMSGICSDTVVSHFAFEVKVREGDE